MKPFIRVLVLFCCLGCGFAVQCCAFSAGDEKEALLDSLEAARLNWLENASFCGNYTFKTGDLTGGDLPQFFRTKEEALTAQIKDKNPEAGFFSKLKNKYRLTCNSRFARQGGNNKFGGSQLLYTTSVANDRFSLSLTRFSNGGQTGAFYFGDDDANSLVKLSGEAGAALSEDAFSRPTILPWMLFSSKIDTIFKTVKDAWEYSKSEDGRVRLTFEGDSPFDQEDSEAQTAYQPEFKITVRYEMTVRTDMGDPVIEQAETTIYTNQNGKTESHSSCFKVFEWKNCGGFNIPARTRHVSQGTTGLSGPSETVWFAMEWESADLGEREPNDDDFRVEVKPTDKFDHLKSIPKNNIIDIDAITDDDYGPAETGARTGRMSGTAARSRVSR